NGALILAGGLSVLPGNGAVFAASGTHRTVFTSPSAVVVTMAGAGAGGGQSHFQDVEILGLVAVTGPAFANGRTDVGTGAVLGGAGTYFGQDTIATVPGAGIDIDNLS